MTLCISLSVSLLSLLANHYFVYFLISVRIIVDNSVKSEKMYTFQVLTEVQLNTTYAMQYICVTTIHPSIHRSHQYWNCTKYVFALVIFPSSLSVLMCAKELMPRPIGTHWLLLASDIGYVRALCSLRWIWMQNHLLIMYMLKTSSDFFKNIRHSSFTCMHLESFLCGFYKAFLTYCSGGGFHVIIS